MKYLFRRTFYRLWRKTEKTIRVLCRSNHSVTTADNAGHQRGAPYPVPHFLSTSLNEVINCYSNVTDKRGEYKSVINIDRSRVQFPTWLKQFSLQLVFTVTLWPWDRLKV
jgi:hypothetical protein